MSIENRLAAKKRSQKARKKAAVAKAVKITLAILIPVLVIAVCLGIYFSYQSKKIEYSKYLTADGKIKNVTAKDCLSALADYNNLGIKLSDYEPTEQEIRKAVKSQYETIKKAEEEAAKKDEDKKDEDKKDDDKKESQSGSSESEDKKDEDKKDESSDDKKDDDKKDESSDKKDDDKKDESSDKKDDDKKDEISDEDYWKILENITDAWVEKNFKEKMGDDYKCTQEDFIKYITDKTRENKKSAMRSDITKKLNENSTVKEYPKKYTKNMIQVYRNLEMQSFEQYSDFYAQYYGVNSVYQLYGDKKKFNSAMEENAKAEVKTTLVLLAIYEEMGLTTSDADVEKYYKEDQGQDYSKLVKSYGEPYLKLQCKCAQVLNKLEESVK